MPHSAAIAMIGIVLGWSWGWRVARTRVTPSAGIVSLSVIAAAIGVAWLAAASWSYALGGVALGGTPWLLLRGVRVERESDDA